MKRYDWSRFDSVSQSLKMNSPAKMKKNTMKSIRKIKIFRIVASIHAIPVCKKKSSKMMTRPLTSFK